MPARLTPASFVIREPSRLRRWSIHSLTKFRTSMKPSVTVRIKISVETAQTVYVCSGLDGTEIAEAERALPDNKRNQHGEQQTLRLYI